MEPSAYIRIEPVLILYSNTVFSVDSVGSVWGLMSILMSKTTLEEIRI